MRLTKRLRRQLQRERTKLKRDIIVSAIGLAFLPAIGGLFAIFCELPNKLLAGALVLTSLALALSLISALFFRDAFNTLRDYFQPDYKGKDLLQMIDEQNEFGEAFAEEAENE